MGKTAAVCLELPEYPTVIHIAAAGKTTNILCRNIVHTDV